MAYNYRKLLGRIRECGLTHKELAEKIGITKGTLSLKLNCKNDFNASEMGAICDVLDIPETEIGIYFFAE